jgi:hypothetical protein
MIWRFLLLLSMIVSPILGSAQPRTSSEDLGSCTLKNFVYHCDNAAFAKALDAAKNVTIEAQNVDSYARARLKDMLSKKYGKQMVETAGAPDLIFLIVPVGVDGINISPGEPVLGSLRVYSAKADGSREHLMWAETYSGSQDLPWPTVVRALILQFEKHFPASKPDK